MVFNTTLGFNTVSTKGSKDFSIIHLVNELQPFPFHIAVGPSRVAGAFGTMLDLLVGQFGSG